jgi:Putative zinc-finger
MDHIESVNNQAVERYLLGQMPEAEIDAFEKHFFECVACAEEVESGILFQENTRAAFPSVPQPAPAAQRNWLWHLSHRLSYRLSHRLSQWWTRPAFAAPALAAGLLAAVTIYQTGFVIPALRQQIAQAHAPQSLLAFALRSGTRGEANQENRITIPAATQAFLIDLDLTDTSFPNYRCELSSDSGPALSPIDSPAPPLGSPLNLLIPAAKLKSGVYTLRVRGMRGSLAGPEIAHYTFVLTLAGS